MKKKTALPAARVEESPASREDMFAEGETEPSVKLAETESPSCNTCFSNDIIGSWRTADFLIWGAKKIPTNLR